jgi:hypothetical protein
LLALPARREVTLSVPRGRCSRTRGGADRRIRWWKLNPPAHALDAHSVGLIPIIGIVWFAVALVLGLVIGRIAANGERAARRFERERASALAGHLAPVSRSRTYRRRLSRPVGGHAGGTPNAVVRVSAQGRL